MLKKFLDKLLINALKKSNQERDIEGFIIQGKRIFAIINNTFKYVHYSLQGTYSYQEVKNLNKHTNGVAKFGISPGNGPIAIIGIQEWNPNITFIEDVKEYGMRRSDRKFEFKEFSDEEAKHIANYTVYGYDGLDEIKDMVKFDKIASVLDSRKKDVNSSEHRILKMKVKVKGKFSYTELHDLKEFWAVDHGMAYGTLDNGEHVAILSFWYDRKDEVAGFRDVWEKCKPEPIIQKITLMDNEEAANISDFSFYLYDYGLYYDFVAHKEPPIEKKDRTLEPGFDFYDTPDGKDLRLTNNF